MQQNLAPDDALALILRHIEPTAEPQIETLPLLEVLGRVLARDLAAPLDLPPFDNSSVDGYAMRARDIEGATPNSPLILPCATTIAATRLDAEPASLGRGSCARIMTGAPVPHGADAIVMREDVDEGDPQSIVFASSTCTGQNIRRRGEDIVTGEVAVTAGTRLRASEIALLAACGLSHVGVATRPRVAIITTGDELAEPGQPLKRGQIYNSNAVSLAALCHECGAQVVLSEHAPDDAHTLAAQMERAARDCDVLLTSGGVSAGDFDPVRDVLLGLNGQRAIATPIFWKASIKPGRPILFATIDRGGRSVPIFALPGNPVSVAVTFELFVRPALMLLQGVDREASRRRSVRAAVDREGESPLGKAEFVRAFVAPGEGHWLASVTGAQGSGRLTTMARANALLVIPSQVARYNAGDEFEARLLS